MRGSVFALLSLLLAPNAGPARAADTVSQTATIRVTRNGGDRVSGCSWQRGRLVGADAAGLTWQPAGSTVTRLTPWSEIGQVDVSRGRHGHAGTGAMVGAAVAAIPGALSGMSAAAALCEGCSRPNYAGGAIIGALYFAVPGALAGAIVGALVRTERWEPASLERLRVSVFPAPRGLEISVAASF